MIWKRPGWDETDICKNPLSNTHRFNDVGRVEGNVLHAWSSVIVHIFLWKGTILLIRGSTVINRGHKPQKVQRKTEPSHLDLWYPLSRCRFIDGHLDSLLMVCHHNGPQGAELRVDLLIIYRPEPVKQQTLGIPGIQKSQTLKKVQNKKAFRRDPASLFFLKSSNVRWAFNMLPAAVKPAWPCLLVLSPRFALPAVCVRALTSPKWAPFHHLAGFPQCDQWTSNPPLDWRQKKKEKKTVNVYSSKNVYIGQ